MLFYLNGGVGVAMWAGPLRIWPEKVGRVSPPRIKFVG